MLPVLGTEKDCEHGRESEGSSITGNRIVTPSLWYDQSSSGNENQKE